MTHEMAIADLARQDKKLAQLIKKIGPCTLPQGRGEPYLALIEAVAHQQVHGNAARAVLARFTQLYEGGRMPTAVELAETPLTTLREIGFSENKAMALHDIAFKTLEGIIPSRKACLRLADDVLIERLTSVRGVGRWTVEMLLMFTLNRRDILPVDDFGIREGYRLHWGLDEQPKPRELAALGARWAPHRSIASWYLWRGLELYRKSA